MGNNMDMKLVKVPAGKFTMGGDPISEQADENETPRHSVTFEFPFYIGQYPVTQKEWQSVMGNNPSHFQDPERPVEMVSFADAAEFIKRLNERESTQAYGLPTEAEWEYAARAGSQSTWCYGPERSRLREYAWFQKNSGGETHPVGQLTPNQWGFYDMHGNVHEWCSDWFDRNYYASSPANFPQGPEKGLAKVLRGGDWGSEDWYCRCAIRSLGSPGRKSARVGFRIAKRIE